MQFLSWNVQGAFPRYTPVSRIEDQIRYLKEQADLPSIIALNEVNRHRSDIWLSELAKIGYREVVHTFDWAEELGESDVPPHQDFNHVNGNVTAVHEDSLAHSINRLLPSIREGPWDGSDEKDWSTNFPEKILHAEVKLDDERLEIWNVRAVPGSMYGEEKVKILENTYQRTRKGSHPPCILAGDFNAPDRELADGTTIPWRSERSGEMAERWVEAELNILSGLESNGMVDVFRSLNGYGDLDVLDVSHATQTSEPLEVPPQDIEGKRFDHIIASTALNPDSCWYDPAGFSSSDHAPIVAEFGL